MKTSAYLKPITLLFSLAWLLLSLQAYGVSGAEGGEPEPEKGPHGGRMLREDNFAVELSIYETGVPPEYRVWVTKDGEPVDPTEVSLQITLTRLGGKEDNIGFTAQDDFLRGDMVIYEPHSFVVNAVARYRGTTYEWTYDNFEGRTRIQDDVAQTMGIETQSAGSATFRDTIEVFGRLEATVDAHRRVTARFDGLIKDVHVELGERVEAGDSLATIESNESLKSYTITAPISGLIQERFVNPGENTNGQPLLTILDPSKTRAKLSVFPESRGQVRRGQPVLLKPLGADDELKGTVALIEPSAQDNQASAVWVTLEDTKAELVPGTFVQGVIETGEYRVPLAVKRSALQSFRDFTVVYAKVGDEYEVRMLDLGREAGEWVEVLGGLNPGTTYVTENSFILKADIEKSGASHDH